jgi:hypothetical protein
MTYRYDVFLSYSRRDPVLPWVRDHFKPQLEQWLTQSMPQDPAIFRDEDSVETGSSWPLVLRQALLTSKITVAVLSPSYFRSSWCLAEWDSVSEREKILGYRTLENPRGLVYPVCFHDGEHFPEAVKKIQYRDLKRFNRATPAFAQTADYYQFVGEMQTVADEIAHLISVAPAWQPTFPVVLPPSAELAAAAPLTLEVPRL